MCAEERIRLRRLGQCEKFMMVAHFNIEKWCYARRADVDNLNSFKSMLGNELILIY